jgi:oligo-1,6-glucosidase
MPWAAGPGAGFTTGTPWLALNANHDEVNAEAARADPDSVFHFYRQLIALRRSEPLLTTGRYRLILEDHPQVYAYMRVAAGGEGGEGRAEGAAGGGALLVMANFSKETAQLRWPDDVASRAAEVLLSNLPVASPAVAALALPLTLAPWEGCWLKLG